MMNSEIMPGWMDHTVIRTYFQSVCIKLSTFEKSRLFILFYSTLLYLSLSLSLSRVRSLLFIDPSMTSEERRERGREREGKGEGERKGGREREGEREGFAAEKFSFLVIFGVFFCCYCYYICISDRPFFKILFLIAAAAARRRWCALLITI